MAPADEPRTDGDPLRLALTYRLAVRQVVGDEPSGAELVIRRTPRTWPDPVQVACEFDPRNPAAVAYAERCRTTAPSTWAAAGMTAPDDGPARPAGGRSGFIAPSTRFGIGHPERFTRTRIDRRPVRPGGRTQSAD